MSKYTQQDIIEEEGIKLLKSYLEPNFFLINDFADIIGKDKYPDIDGQIRLRDGNGTYLNRYLHYQTKSHQNITKLNKYYLTRKVIDYLIETNVPTLFFVVDINTKKCFWFYISEQIKKAFNLSANNKGRSIDLTKNEIKNNSPALQQKWQNFAKGDNYEEITGKLDKILNKFQINVKSCLGVLYLFRVIKKQDLPQIFANILNIKSHESLTIINHLKDEEIISSTVNYYLLENDKIGIESLFFLLDSKLLDVENLDNLLKVDDQKAVFEQLNKINHPKVNQYFKDLSKQFIKSFPKVKTNDDIFAKLELLEKYIYRVPNEAIKILKYIINSKKPLKAVTKKLDGWGNIKGTSHEDLVAKSIELLERLRYIKPKDVFNLLLKLTDSPNKEKANNTLKKVAEYNLFVLQKIGYQPQLFLLDEIKQFGDRKLIRHFNSLVVILEEIINPSFEGSEMTDYKTVTIRHGGLVAHKSLKKARGRAIETLEKLYTLSKTILQKKQIIQILNKTTHTPHGHYTKELEDVVLQNTNKIIAFYIQIIGDADHEIIKEIEEQTHWFLKIYSGRLKNIKKLQSLIAQNDEYGMFKCFVGYDYRFDKDLDWREAGKERKRKIQGFVNQVSFEKFKEWQKKILSVINNYNQIKDYGKYQYFNIFLNELGKQKPKIAQKLIQNNEKELEEFLIHIVAGIWQSRKKKIAIELIEKWLQDLKFLSVCTYIFAYVKEIDEILLKKVFQKAKKVGDTNALNNIIQSIVENYPDTNQYIKLFVKTIKELTKHENYWWINNVWYQKDSIIKILTEKDFDIILKNLLFSPNIDYHVEEILKPITEQYPQKVVHFFERRVAIQSKEKKEDRYDAIPYNFHKLSTVLQKHGAIIIPKILKWFNKRNWLFKWEGGHLLKNIFSVNQLDDELIKLLNTQKEENIKSVLSIFNTYQGHITLDSKAVQTLIRKYPKYHNNIISSMSATGGVVSGEYGFVTSLKGKKEALQKWKNEKRKYIQGFIKKYEESLDKQIDFEKKRADEDLALRMHEYK